MAPATHVSIDLLADRRVVAAGQRFWLAFRERIEPGWHTYWSNPGDSGLPTKLRVSVPAGFTVGAIEWPAPAVIPAGPLIDYGYSGEALLLLPVLAPEILDAGSVPVTVEAEWLVCKDICIPERGTARLALAAGPVAIASADDTQISALVRQLPAALAAAAEVRVGPATLELRVRGLHREDAPHPRFVPAAWGELENAAPQPARWDGTELTLGLERGDLKGQPLPLLAGLLLLDATAGQGTRSYRVSAPAVAGAPAGGTTRADSIGWPVAVLFAFLGGLILNLMPCVLPVLALKALAFAREAEPRARAGAQAFAYLAGVLSACLALGLSLAALRRVGVAVGWGFQLQSPAFVMLLAALLFAMALSLSGVFTLGATLAGAGDRLTRRPGLAGSFAVGVLATTAATPCTAPFMGAAVAFALGRGGWQASAVMLALGLGFAAPLVLLQLLPGLRRRVPTPGAWMETFKQLLAFPLYATAAWLVWVLSEQSGSDGVRIALAVLTAIGFAGWLAGRTERRSSGPAAAAVLAAAAIGLGLLALRPVSPADTGGGAPQAYSAATLAALRGAGRPVFLNVTAAWCITCKVNERMALASDRVRRAFRDSRVAYLVADWTREDPNVTSLLEHFGRDGVPLYVYFPPSAQAEPVILPQLLTEERVLAAITATGSHP